MAKRITKAADNPDGRRPENRAGRVKPTESVGMLGTAIYAGNIVSVEEDQRLQGVEKYRTFGKILANVSIVGAGVRFFLNMVARAKWKVEPAKDSGAAGQELADKVDQILQGMETPWYRIVRKAAMFPFYGFSVMEWVAKKDEDGTVVFADVENRPQNTIERWDTDETGKVLAVLQTSPQTGKEVPIPREKVVYVVDDSVSDSPEGLGLFRHIVDACARLRRYEQLEGFGYEGDLRGIPLVRAPLTAMRERVKAGQLSKADMDTQLQPLKDFITNHIKNPSLGMMLDSEVFRNKDAAASPSGVYQWMVELLEGGEYSLQEVAAAIERVTLEIARVLGVENLLLGSGSAGSFALSKDKSNNFGLTIDGTLKALREAFEKDLLGPLWLLNGWDPELKPKLVTDTNATRDLESVSSVIRDLSAAGVVLDREDDAVGELFELMGLPRPKGQILVDPDAQLGGEDDKPEDEDEVPTEDEGDEDVPTEDEDEATKAARREYVRAPKGTATGGQFASGGGGGGGGDTPASALQTKVLDKGGKVQPGSFNEKGERTMTITGDKGTVSVTVNRAGDIITSSVTGNAKQKRMPQLIMRTAFNKP